jgi:hypothetical protein
MEIRTTNQVNHEYFSRTHQNNPLPFPSLYEITGKITDINTMLINRKELELLLELLLEQKGTK